MSIAIPTFILHLIIALYLIIVIGLTALLIKNRHRYRPLVLVLLLAVLWLMPVIGIIVAALSSFSKYSAKNIEL